MIEIQDVSKQFDCVTALRHLTLKVQDGSVFGLVGSNGAGKSTLMNILFGMPVIHDTGGFEGTVEIDGDERTAMKFIVEPR